MTALAGNTDTGGIPYDWYIQQGSTTRAKTFTIAVDGNPAVITKVEMALKRFGEQVHLYSSDTSDFLIAGDTFTWAEHELNIPKGEYQYDLKITHDGGKIDRFMHGLVIVHEEITP
jgi:hypothetical protein